MTLIVNDGKVNSAPSTTFAKIAEVNDPPVAEAGPDQSVLVNVKVAFKGSASYDPDGTITSYAWNFGDGSTGTGVSVTHAYSAIGTYTVTLTVTDNGGLRRTDTCKVTVSALFTGTVLPNRESTRHAVNVKTGAKSIYVKLTWSATDDLRLRVYNPSGTMLVQVDKSTSLKRVEETTLQNPVTGSWKVAAFSESVSKSIFYTIKVTVNY